ncbi:peptidoglycan-binding protein [Streptomyces sp. NPDC006274]|jgi:peptidoglycan hydrolase-like protein with peptidoglycan-binding domain|uniref:peptidoglycan-binding protein n=1 Tax=unclassified Streptomyces TaxID=2593676 RepID=UPI0033A16EC4
MPATIISRATWGARPWDNDPASNGPTHVSLSSRTEFFVHYDGAHHITSTGYAIPRAIDYQHQTKGWAGIGYNFVVDQAGNIYEGRGWLRQGAHCPGHNISGIGVQIAVGGDQKPTEAALAACRWLYDEACRRTGRTLAKRGHRDGIATQCPGDILYAWVEAGMPAKGYEPPADGTAPQGGTSGTVPDVARYRVTINGLAYGYGAHGDHVTQVGRALVARGHGDAYQVGPGPRWSDADTANYAAFQRSLGYRGADADGVPGETSLERLLGTLPGGRPAVDLSQLVAAARRDPAKKGTPVSYGGARVVEQALAAEGLLDERYVDGHFGTATVTAYAAWQRSLGYRGRDADGIPGMTSLARLGAKHGFTVKG